MLTRPVGKDRPRFNSKTGSVYTPNRSQVAEWAIRQEWEKTPTVFTRPVAVNVVAYFPRPSSHVKRDGGLTAAGKNRGRDLGPVGKPDADNILKLVMDSLNGWAFQDDASVLKGTVEKRWGDAPMLVITIRELSDDW